jgi:SWI/SNF-related matrix-associated actin-dependent regulator of chromatin subfamily A3
LQIVTFSIRNSKTGFFKAITQLHAERKLCLTGTPFVNKPDDIHSLLAFLGVQPLCKPKVFKTHVTQKIANRKEAGLATIRTTMAYIALRRKKSEVEGTIKLVSKDVQHRHITFPEGDHKTIHDVLFASAKSAFLGLLRLGDDQVVNNFMALLTLLLRVRQACCHGELVPLDYRERATEVFEEVKRRGLGDMSEEECEALLARIRGTFQQEELQECAVCFNEMEEESAVILRTCKHILCQPCLNQIHNCLCPFCRVPYTEDDMVKKADAQKAAREKKRAIKVKSNGGKGGIGRSPKIQAMFDAIDEMAPDEKGVIFSQWTYVLMCVCPLVYTRIYRTGSSHLNLLSFYLQHLLDYYRGRIS